MAEHSGSSSAHDLFLEVMAYAPAASSITGMLFYSFIVFLFLTCLRRIRNDTLYPQMAKSMQNASNKHREETRRRRSEEAQKMAEKLS